MMHGPDVPKSHSVSGQKTGVNVTVVVAVVVGVVDWNGVVVPVDVTVVVTVVESHRT